MFNSEITNIILMEKLLILFLYLIKCLWDEDARVLGYFLNFDVEGSDCTS